MRQFTIEDAIAARNAAVATVGDNADDAWKVEAYAFLLAYCRAHETIFCDDLWSAGLTPPREARALGAIMQRAAREGLIRRSGQYRPSVRSNMTPKPVWISTVWRAP